jgi:hypothetical protein
MPDTYMGMRYYLDAAARALGLEDTGPFPPVGLASRSRPLQLIESQISAALRTPDPTARRDILRHTEEIRRAIDLERDAADAMISHIYEVLGLDRPADPIPSSAPESEAPDAVAGTREADRAQATRTGTGTGPAARAGAATGPGPAAGRHARGA